MGNELKESIKDCLDWIWFEGAKAAKGEKHKSISKVVDETAAQILNLVRDDMKKLTILGDKEIEVASQVNMFLPDGSLDPDCGYLRGRKQVAQAQLEHNIDQLKEIIGET